MTDDWLTASLVDGMPVFQLAAHYGRFEMVQLFFAKDPNVLNSMEAYGQTALVWAAASGHEYLY